MFKEYALPYLILMRPANIVTAVADILAGIAIAGLLMQGISSSVILLIVSTMGLYGGGVVFNDIFDRVLDKIERPERPLPSGSAELNKSIALGILLLVIGIVAAALNGLTSGIIAIVIASLALIYDKWGKHHSFLGPLNMGLCRSFNLLLGMSIVPEVIFQYWYLAVIPLVFIADITLTSQGEVKGNNQNALRFALGLDFVVVIIFMMVLVYNQLDTLSSLIFLLLWLGMNSISKIKAIRINNYHTVMNAVKLGVLSLIPLNAAITAGFQGWISGFLVLLLLPLSYGLAKVFSVT